MRRTLGAFAVLAGLGGLGGGLAGCGPDGRGDDVDADAGRRLEQQRDDVRAAASRLQRAAADALSGTVAGSTGRFRGCEAGGLEEYRNFRYEAQARIDVPADTGRPYLRRLAPVFEEAGFTPAGETERPGGRSLRGEDGELAASFSELPEAGDHVLLAVAGPCVDVPEEDRDAWLTRREPQPDIS